MKYTEEAYQLTDEENLAPVYRTAPQRSSRAGFAAALVATALGSAAVTYRVARPAAAAPALMALDGDSSIVVHAYVDAM